MPHADRLFDEVGLGARELLLEAFLASVASPVHALNPLTALGKDIERHDGHIKTNCLGMNLKIICRGGAFMDRPGWIKDFILELNRVY